jgi:hypothetical protein
MSHHAVSRRVVRRGMSRHAVRCRVAPRRVIPDGNGGIDGNGVTASRVRQKPRRLDRYATARRSSTRRARSAARRRAARRRAPRAAAADAEEARGQLRAPRAKISARTPTRSQKPRRRDRAAQLDAPRPSRSPTRRGSTPRAACGRRRCRRSRMPKKLKQPKVDGAGTKIVFRDGAAGGFEPAPLNRRCLPETTSPPREAGASESAVTTYEVTIQCVRRPASSVAAPPVRVFRVFRVFRVRELAGRSGSASETPPRNPPRR